MKRAMTLSSALGTWMLAATTALAQNGIQQPQLVAPLPPVSEGLQQANFDDAAPAAEEPAKEEAADEAAPAAAGCGCAEEASCGCEEASCGCEPSCGCDSCGCDSGFLSCMTDDCCLGDPCTLKDHVSPCCEHNFGGWMALGYYNNNERLSVAPNDLRAFLDNPDHLNLDQAWLYAEKVADSSGCSADWGYRADVVYGVDAQKTQAFGNDDNVWDVSLDHGSYGWAIPQAYAELGFSDWSVKVGHFFTPVGYEVIPATGNFFYSHAYTMYNSEPFTHTGVLGTYNGNENVTLYAGWTLGWDTGYDQALGGSNWLGGFSTTLIEDVTVTYISTAGNFGLRSAGQDGYSQSVVAVADLSDKYQYVFQTDWVAADGFYGDPTFDNDEYGVNQYLFYTVSDCWKLGTRMEWWKSNSVTGESASFYELTGGINYKPHANVVVRPEIRYNWAPGDVAAGNALGVNDFNNTVFGIDAIVTF